MILSSIEKRHPGLYGITGGPSVGKTEIIKALARRDEVISSEAATDLKMERIAQGIAAPWEEPNFEVDIFNLKIQREADCIKEALTAQKTRCFCDRTFWDSLVYIEHLGKTGGDEHLYIEEKLIELNAKTRYVAVFLIEHWNGSYVAEKAEFRHESTIEAQQLHERIKGIYERAGISLISVPTGTPDERAEYILRTIERMRVPADKVLEELLVTV